MNTEHFITLISNSRKLRHSGNYGHTFNTTHKFIGLKNAQLQNYNTDDVMYFWLASQNCDSIKNCAQIKIEWKQCLFYFDMYIRPK